MYKEMIICLCMSMIIGVSGLYADQQIVFDGEHTWDGSSGDWRPEWEGDSNWEDLGYYGGHFYIRAEVKSMKKEPTSSDFYLQICNWKGGEMCMSEGDLKFKSTGVISADAPPSNWWTKSPASFNDHYGKMKWVLKYANKWAETKSASYTYGPGITEVVPVTLHLTAITASSGEAADISSFDWPCPSNWECTGGSEVKKKHISSKKENSNVDVNVTNSIISVDNIKENERFSLYTTQGQLLASIHSGDTHTIDISRLGGNKMCIGVLEFPGGSYSQTVCIR